MTAGERFQSGRFRPAKACLPHRSRTPTMTSKQKYTNPQVCEGLGLHQVPMKLATNENLKGMGVIVDDPADFTVEKKTFEIATWPTSGWRKMDPGCGDEAGTCEGKFDIYWDGDLLYGKNHSIASPPASRADFSREGKNGEGSSPTHVAGRRRTTTCWATGRSPRPASRRGAARARRSRRRRSGCGTATTTRTAASSSSPRTASRS